jgi:apolipoprotein N-acyltransferase
MKTPIARFADSVANILFVSAFACFILTSSWYKASASQNVADENYNLVIICVAALAAACVLKIVGYLPTRLEKNGTSAHP